MKKNKTKTKLAEIGISHIFFCIPMLLSANCLRFAAAGHQDNIRSTLVEDPPSKDETKGTQASTDYICSIQGQRLVLVAFQEAVGALRSQRAQELLKVDSATWKRLVPPRAPLGT